MLKGPQPLNDDNLSVVGPTEGLKDAYERFVLISHRDQLRACDMNDADSLIVTSDWLAWRLVAEAGGHGIHFEAALAEWPGERGDPDRHLLESSRWMLNEGHDQTMFRGVSLGRQFTVPIARFRHAYLRMWHALDRLCRRYGPRVIVFFDLRAEYDVLDDDVIGDLVREAADRHGATFADRHDPAQRDRHTYPMDPVVRAPGRTPAMKRWFLELYEVFVDAAFRLRAAFAPAKPRVFVFLNWAGVSSLIHGAGGLLLTPVLTIRPWPKSFDFLVQCWRQGIVLARLPGCGFDADDETAVKNIVSAIDALYAQPATPLAAAEGTFVRRRIVNSGWLRGRAREVKSYERLFERRRIKRILIGDAENMLGRTLVGVGAAQEIPSDELFNGLRTTRQLTDVHHPEPTDNIPLSRFLSRGEQDEAWLRQIGSTLPSVRTGYPVVASIARRNTYEGARGKAIKALILPLLVQRYDVKALFANTFANLVDVARTLSELGYREFRVKLHPGHIGAKPNFEAVLDHYHMAADVVVSGPLSEHVDWADIVVGPVNTGAMVETFARGKPYYAFRARPSSVDPTLCGNIRVLETGEELHQALKEDGNTDAKADLEYYCSTTSIPDPAGCVWRVIEDAACRVQPTNDGG